MTEKPIRITPRERAQHGPSGAFAIAIDKMRTIYLEHTGKIDGKTVVITMKVEGQQRDAKNAGSER